MIFNLSETNQGGGGESNGYDIIIRCTANAFSSNISDYEVVKGDYLECTEKAMNGELVTGIVYIDTGNGYYYDDDEAEWYYSSYTKSMPLHDIDIYGYGNPMVDYSWHFHFIEYSYTLSGNTIYLYTESLSIGSVNTDVTIASASYTKETGAVNKKTS